jgi:radical SAM protein with 4Fe4S-binding SPASM domain
MLHFEKYACGNLNTERMADIYRNSTALNELRTINIDAIPKCKVCAYRNICGGACRARVDIDKYGIKGADDFCPFEQKTILDALLYSYDGITAKDGRVLIMTTNHKENIDPALLRPGRIDLDVEIGHITDESFRKFIRVFYEKECTKKLRNEMHITGAQLQNDYITNHLTYEQIMDKYAAN